MLSFKRLLKLPAKKSFFVFGPRQVGKSTLIREAFCSENTLYYDLLKLDEYSVLATDPARFRSQVKSRPPHVTHVIIDEIQKLPELLDEIHSLIESPNAPAFVMSGSSARKLKRAGANLLGGRAWNLSMFPLTHVELAEQFDFYKALQYGSLPAIYRDAYLGDVDSAKKHLRAYVETYLEEEIKSEAIVRNLASFIFFTRLAAAFNSKIINYTNISQELRISAATVKDYYQILVDTLLGFFLYPYSKSVNKKLSKHPKFYFFDLGVTRALSGRINLGINKMDPEFGGIFEHFIIKEIVHLSKYLEKDFEFNFYRTSNDAEVDLIVTKPDGTVYAIEIKSSDNPRRSELKGLKSFQEVCPTAKLVCACMAPKSFNYDDIRVMPWQNIFKELELS